MSGTTISGSPSISALHWTRPCTSTTAPLSLPCIDALTCSVTSKTNRGRPRCMNGFQNGKGSASEEGGFESRSFAKSRRASGPTHAGSVSSGDPYGHAVERKEWTTSLTSIPCAGRPEATPASVSARSAAAESTGRGARRAPRARIDIAAVPRAPAAVAAIAERAGTSASTSTRTRPREPVTIGHSGDARSSTPRAHKLRANGSNPSVSSLASVTASPALVVIVAVVERPCT
mmetsp:Transcript_7472/g.24811  ORF Transcript_7472/g.24811 Transcript_7472/m.24811 type:complete len:232 (+) Transcript_7472:4022-4717(+)